MVGNLLTILETFFNLNFDLFLSILERSFKLILLLFILHYCYYQWIWKRFISPSPRSFDEYLRLNQEALVCPEDKKPRKKTKPTMGSLEDMKVSDFIREVRFFKYLEPALVNQIAQAAEVVYLGAGDHLPATDSGVFLLKKGQIKLEFQNDSVAGQQQSIIFDHSGSILTSLFEVTRLMTSSFSGTGPSETPPAFKGSNWIALVDSEVIRVPTELIRRLSEQNATEAHNSIRIVMTRFQRLASSALFPSLGLTREQFSIDTAVRSKIEDVGQPIGTLRGVFVHKFVELIAGKDAGDAVVERLRQDINSIVDVRIEEIQQDSTSHLACNGVYYLLNGEVRLEHCEDSDQFELIEPGRLFGSTLSLAGGKTIISIKAVSPMARLLWLNPTAVERVFEKHSRCYLGLAQLIIPNLSPLSYLVDLSSEWLHLDAGTMVCEQGKPADSFYLVVHGRIKCSSSSSSLAPEIGPGDTYGEAELFQEFNWPVSMEAIRDAELLRFPKDLFQLLLKASPKASLRLAKLLATRHQQQRPEIKLIPHRPSKTNHIKTLAIIPSNVAKSCQAAETFCRRLYATLCRSASCTVLTKSAVITTLGKHTFTAYGKLKLLEWLNKQEDNHRVVIYFADAPGSPWTQRCLRQADCVFVVADAREEPCLGEYEQELLDVPSNVRMELILVHQSAHCPSGLTRRWLSIRPWISQHHHIALPGTGRSRTKSRASWRLPEINWLILADQLMTQGFRPTLETFYNAARSNAKTMSSNPADQDVERLARRVLGTGIGLVLGGGGARGISHIGIIKTLLDAGIPIDAVGGTSIGSLVGGLYARDSNLFTSTALLRVFSSLMSSTWRLAYDLTYPFCAWFTGEQFNRVLWKIFDERLIEDMWLPFFCITTDITTSRMAIHRSGLAWRYIRASMSLSGFLPPLWDINDSLLLDGGYVNNLPVDVMIQEHAHLSTVLAVDVGSERTDTDQYYPDEVSGLWLSLKQLFGLRVATPNLAEIQSRLAYVSCVDRIKQVRHLANDPSTGIKYLRPPVQSYGTLQFGSFDEIRLVGEAYARDILAGWATDGTLEGLKDGRKSPIAKDNVKSSLYEFESFHHRQEEQQPNDLPVDDEMTPCLHRRRRSL